MKRSLDLDAYLARIRYQGPTQPTLATLNALTFAHSVQIPFENLDVLLDQRIALDSGALQKKLVQDRRGGYCFEQNGLFLEVLAALGFQVRPLGARVRWQRPRDFVPPRTHLFVEVMLDGAPWLTDVGVGGMSLTGAIRLDVQNEQATPHEPRRILCEDGRLFHQAKLGLDWHDVCEFTLETMHPIDRELANWFTCAHPDSHFKHRLLVARATPTGRITLLNDELTVRDGVSVEKRKLTSTSELIAVLRDHFGLNLPLGAVLPLPTFDAAAR